VLLGALALVDQLEAPVADSHVPMTLAPVPSESRRTALEPLDPLPTPAVGV